MVTRGRVALVMAHPPFPELAIAWRQHYGVSVRFREAVLLARRAAVQICAPRSLLCIGVVIQALLRLEPSYRLVSRLVLETKLQAQLSLAMPALLAIVKPALLGPRAPEDT